MTVSYQYEVASSTSGGFTRLLFMWRGSLYKLIYRELFLFIAAFGLLSALYRHAFNHDQKRIFEKMVVYCDTFINLIPLSFVLGFYVAYVAGRWWQQYMAIPWPDKIMHSIALYVCGNDVQGRMIRRTLMRYLNLTLVLVLRSISSAVKRRLPTLDHVVESGFMTVVELEMFQSVPSVEFNTYWIPCTWFISLLKETKKGSRITDTQGLKIIMEEFNDFRSKCGLLWSYDWVSIPLVYTQVVTIATYSFFLAALVGRQYVDTAKKPLQMEIDIYIPVFTILQFFFFMGLLKVAEQLINPFGDDDEDFELNWLIDRHTKVSYLGVDILMSKSPPLVKDMYFDQVDLTLPYTEAAVAYKKKTYRGSVHNMEVPEDKHTMFLPEISEEDEVKPHTPNASMQNLKSGKSFHSMFAAPTSAGIWRSQQQLSCSVPELQTGFVSSQKLEVPLDAANTFFGRKERKTEEEVVTMAHSTNGDPLRLFSQPASAPVKKTPVIDPSSKRGLAESSTSGEADTSFQSSETSSDAYSCPNLSESDCGDESYDHSFNCPHTTSKNLPERDLQTKKNESNRQHALRSNFWNIPSEEMFEFKTRQCTRVMSCPRLIPIKHFVPSYDGSHTNVQWRSLESELVDPSKYSQFEGKQLFDVLPRVQKKLHSTTTNSSSISRSDETTDLSLLSKVNQTCIFCKKKCNIPLHKQCDDASSIARLKGSLSETSLCHEKTHTSMLQQMMNTSTENVCNLKHSYKKSDHLRRGTANFLNLSGSEFDTKRWQSGHFWEHRFCSGFLKKIKDIQKQMRSQHILLNPMLMTETETLLLRKCVSQSLPNMSQPVHQKDTYCSQNRDRHFQSTMSTLNTIEHQSSHLTPVDLSLLEVAKESNGILPIERRANLPINVVSAACEESASRDPAIIGHPGSITAHSVVQNNSSIELESVPSNENLELENPNSLQEIVIDCTDGPKSCIQWLNQNGS